MGASTGAARDVRGCREAVCCQETTGLPFIYILRCRDGSLYTGAAKDLAARVLKHAAGRASKYTRGRRPLTLVWSRRVRTWSAALREEYRIKKLKRREKDALVSRKDVRASGKDALASKKLALKKRVSPRKGTGG